MSNNLAKKKYKILPVALKKEIQKRFESGENLLDLSIEYGIPYGSLKNMSSKNGWVKGKTAEILLVAEYLNESQEKLIKKEEIKQEYREQQDKLLIAMKKTEYMFEKDEVAHSNRAKALKDSYALSKELYDIRTPKEELELRTLTAKYHELIGEIEKHKLKVVDLDDEDDEIEEAELIK